MKYILLFIFLFIPNIYAKNDAISCEYTVNEKSIVIDYYIDENGKGEISNFYIDGELGYEYTDYYNMIDGDNLTLVCPHITEIKLYKDKYLHYVITKDDSDYKVNDNFIDYTHLVPLYLGQIEAVAVGQNKKSRNYTHYTTEEINSGVGDEARKQMDINIKAYTKGACSYVEKTAIAEYFYENSLDAIDSFSGSNTFMHNNQYITLSSECAKIAQDLYVSVFNIRRILSDYVDGGGDVNTISYLSLQGSYYSGFDAFTTPWYDNSVSEDACDAISQDVRKILNEFFNIFRLVSVILVIFLISLDLVKTLSKNDDTEIKKMINRSVKRMIALVLALLLPFLMNFILDLVNDYMGNSYVNVNGECVKAITGG